jgi:GntR family transcriptional regulator, sialic acid-inducible nan operon repressor
MVVLSTEVGYADHKSQENSVATDQLETGRKDVDRTIKRRRMHEDLVDMLAADIQEGVYAPGDSLPSERALMDEYGVSRLTVREATAALEAMGLIETRPGTRARVCAPQPEFLLGMLSQAATFYLQQPGGLRSFSEVRQIVEAGVARLAAPTATDAQIRALEEALSANREAIGDADLFGRTDIAFHQKIADIVDNPIINAFFTAIDRWLHEVRHTSLKIEGQMDTAFAAHERIFRAIKERDPEAAEREMLNHLRQLASIYPPAPASGKSSL